MNQGGGLFAIVALACLLSATGPAQAASGVVELKAEGPCLSAETLEQRLLGGTRNPLDPSLRVTIEGLAPHALSFSIWRGSELVAVRSFSAQSGDCEDLVDALALAIALGLDAVYVAPPRVAPPRVAPKTPKRKPDRPARKLASEARAPRLLGGGLLVSGLGDMLAGGVSLGVAWTFAEPFALLLGAAATWPTESNLGTGIVVSQLVLGSVRLCHRTSGGSFAVLACAGADAGPLFARGERYASAGSGVGAWAAAGVGPALAYEAKGGFGVLVSLDGLLAFARPHFEVQDPTQSSVASARPSRFVWRLGVSASYALF